MLVTNSFILFIVVLGACIGVMAMLATYLFFLSRPAIENDAPVSDRIRHAAGVFMLMLMVTFLYWIPIVVLKEMDSPVADYYYQLGIQLDMLLIVPSFFAWLFSLLQQATSRKRMILRWSLLLIPLLLLIAYIFTGKDLLTGISISLWSMYSVVVLIQYVFLLGRYHRKLRQTYTDLTHRSLYWLYGMAFFALAELVLYLFTYMREQMLPMLLALQDVFTVGLAIYITYFVDRQSLLTVSDGQLLVVEEDEDTQDETVVVEEKELSERMLMIDSRLKLLCEEQQLYLDSSLDASMLARTIGTNRTYLSEYFAARGTTFYGYINGLRIRYACELLNETGKQLSISELAIRCGYNNVSTFRRLFVEKMGYAPSQYVPQPTIKKALVS